MLYKYNKVYIFQNVDIDGMGNAVQTSYLNIVDPNCDKDFILYTGDEAGLIKGWNLYNVIRFSKIQPVKKEHLKLQHKIFGKQLKPEDLSFIKIKPLFIILAHIEPIRHLDFIDDPKTIISTGYAGESSCGTERLASS